MSSLCITSYRTSHAWGQARLQWNRINDLSYDRTRDKEKKNYWGIKGGIQVSARWSHHFPLFVNRYSAVRVISSYPHGNCQPFPLLCYLDTSLYWRGRCTIEWFVVDKSSRYVPDICPYMVNEDSHQRWSTILYCQEEGERIRSFWTTKSDRNITTF